ncbi:hypothetical protein D9613_009953 [Agrocybe pediades]|uniref:Uncharacterized protein n=1 Tax=Agrocybe pediades TaxID=84607 RepID=A0A8H4QXS9_9AGAR|nr:hypothetical protein D9613_009953 [Agrocybe pediades]
MASAATPTDLTASVAVEGQPTSSSKSLNTSSVNDENSTTLVDRKDQGTLDGSSTSAKQVAASKTSTASSEEGSHWNKNDATEVNDVEDVDEDRDDDYDDEDGEDSDPDFPKFPDNGRGRIVGPVAGQKPKPRPK